MPGEKNQDFFFFNENIREIFMKKRLMTGRRERQLSRLLRGWPIPACTGSVRQNAGVTALCRLLLLLEHNFFSKKTSRSETGVMLGRRVAFFPLKSSTGGQRWTHGFMPEGQTARADRQHSANRRLGTRLCEGVSLGGNVVTAPVTGPPATLRGGANSEAPEASHTYTHTHPSSSAGLSP